MKNDKRVWPQTLSLLGLLLALVCVLMYAVPAVVAQEPRVLTGGAEAFITPTLQPMQSAAPQADNVYGVTAAGNYAYIGHGNRLEVVNISNPATPIYVGQSVDLGGTVFDIAISGNYAYVATGGGHLKVLNIANPAAPSVVGSYTARGSAEGIALSGNYAYLTDNVGLLIISIANPAAPTLTGAYSYGANTNTTSVAVAGNYAYVADVLYSRMFIINVSNPAAPTLTGVYSAGGWAADVAVSGNYAYVMTWAPFVVEIVNVANPASPVKVGSYPYAGSKGVRTIGSYSYVAAGDSFRIVNVSNPAAPTLTGTYSPLSSTWDMAINGNYAYVTGETTGLSIINIANPVAPNRVGFYSIINQPPNTPTNPNPAHTATNVALTAALSWSGSDPNNDPLTYEVRFGTANPPPQVVASQSTTTYDPPGSLANSTTYYWQIVANDSRGGVTPGSVWSFTTATPANQPPNAPANPNPANNATNVAVTAAVSWTGSDPENDALTYEVRFGTTNPPPQAVASQSGTSYDPTGNLANSTTYYWQVIAKDATHPGGTAGPVWSFTTAGGTPTFPNVFYLSPAANVTIAGIAAQGADILRYTKSSNSWTMVYDGSVRGTLKNISAFALTDDGSLLLVFSANQVIAGLGTATPYDVVKFTPNTPGVFPLGAGTYSWFFQGRTKGLTTTAEKIDAFDLVGTRLLLSTTGAASVPLPGGGVLKAADEDAFTYNPTNNEWLTPLRLDGSIIPGLAAEDVNGIWDDPQSDDYYITILGVFNLGGVSGNDKSIVRLAPNGSGGWTPSLITWLAPGATFAGKIDGLEIAR